MSIERNRGFDEPSGRRTAKVRVKPGRMRLAVRLLVRTFFKLAALVFVVAIIGTSVFIGTKCYNGNNPVPASSSAKPRGAEAIRHYLRAEAYTYLTLPEWFIVYSADEYAAFISRQRPSQFPYVGSARQYWGYYASACAVTKREYAFEGGYQVMLGVIGASHTIESGIKALYEGTVGRLTEWLATTDTPEDAFAQRTAREYGAFMHTVPWYEFPFGSKVLALWRDTPIWGPHLLRKLERRMALTLEYGGKAVYGWIIGQGSGAAYEEEELRIHAKIENAPASVFADSRVQRVTQVGSGAYIVTLPRYEEFTKVALAMNALGVRFVDIAGNDEILVTALARRGVSTEIPQARLVAVAPILTDPTLQRLAFSIPVTALGEVSAYLARDHTVIEHLYDY